MKAALELLERKKSRLRGWVLLLLCCIAVCLCLPKEAEPLPDVQTTERGEAALAGMKVALDPGHGGYDGGARARDSGRWEKDINLEIALAVEKELAAQGAQVILTRREDVCLSEGNTATKARKREDLQQRVNIALENQADVFLSIHMNEYRSRSESGPQVFYQRGGDAGRLLAGVLQKHLIAGWSQKRNARLWRGTIMCCARACRRRWWSAAFSAIRQKKSFCCLPIISGRSQKPLPADWRNIGFSAV